MAFESTATNLVEGGTTFGTSHVYVHDRQTGETTLVSRGPTGLEGNSHSYDPSISADSHYVAFASEANSLVHGGTALNRDHVYIRHLQLAKTTLASVDSDSAEGNNDTFNPSISADGRYVAFTSQATNLVEGGTALNRRHIYVRALWYTVYIPVVVKPSP